MSKSAVSRLVLRLEESYRTWQRRDLAQETTVYLYVDAIYPKVRSADRLPGGRSGIQRKNQTGLTKEITAKEFSPV